MLMWVIGELVMDGLVLLVEFGDNSEFLVVIELLVIVLVDDFILFGECVLVIISINDNVVIVLMVVVMLGNINDVFIGLIVMDLF